MWAGGPVFLLLLCWFACHRLLFSKGLLVVFKVNITCYGDISLFQTEPQLEAFAGRTPTFAHAPKDLLGNLTWLNDLFVTNKERLKGKVEDAIIRSALKEPCREKTTSIKRPVAYKQIHVAGDGRCGWRAIKAFEDIKRFQSVPRTAVHCMGTFCCSLHGYLQA